MSAKRHRFEFAHPTMPSNEDHVVFLTLSVAGADWSGLCGGPTGGAYGMGPPQNLTEFLASPKVALPKPMATEIRNLARSLLSAPERIPVLAWTREQILAALPDVDALETRDAKGETALTKAVYNKWMAEVRDILDTGVDPDQPKVGTWRSIRPLGIACESPGGNPDGIRLLLEAGADPHHTASHRSYLGSVMSQYLGLPGRTAGVPLLLDAGVHPDHPPEGWSTPMMQAVLGTRLDIAALLLERGADLNTVRKNGTALTLAASQAKNESVRWLLEHGARVDLPDRKGRTPLDRAAATSVTTKAACVAVLEEWKTQDEDRNGE